MRDLEDLTEALTDLNTTLDNVDTFDLVVALDNHAKALNRYVDFLEGQR